MNRTVKILKPIDGHKPGDIVKVPCDKNGVPKNIKWRRRFKDSELDGCCEVVPVKQKRSKKEVK